MLATISFRVMFNLTNDTNPANNYTTNTLDVNVLSSSMYVHATQDQGLIDNITFFGNIQAAINACQPNGTVSIHIAPAPYTGSGNRSITWPTDRDITVRGLRTGNNIPVIECDGFSGFNLVGKNGQNKLTNLKIQSASVGVTLTNSYPQLIGLELVECMRGMLINNNSTIGNEVKIMECKFIENANIYDYSLGVAISATTRKLTIEASDFIGNMANDTAGASLYFSGRQLQLENNLFQENSGQRYGANVYIEHMGFSPNDPPEYSFITVNGNSFIKNSSSQMGVAYRASTNITFFNVGYYEDISLTRNIFWNNGDQMAFPSVSFWAYLGEPNITNTIKYINNTAVGSHGYSWGRYELEFYLEGANSRLPYIEIKNSIIRGDVMWWDIATSPYITNVSIRNSYIFSEAIPQGMPKSDIIETDTLNMGSIIDLTTSQPDALPTFQPIWTSVTKSSAIDNGHIDTNGNGILWYYDSDDQDWDETRNDIGAVQAMEHGAIVHNINEDASNPIPPSRTATTAWVCFPYIDGLYTGNITADNNSYDVKDLVYNLHYYHDNNIFAGAGAKVAWKIDGTEHSIQQLVVNLNNPQHNLDSRYGYKITKKYSPTYPAPPAGTEINIETAGFRKGLTHNPGYTIPIQGVSPGTNREVWVGYFRLRSERPLVALQDIIHNLIEIKTKYWTISKDINGNWINDDPAYCFNFGEAVSLKYVGANDTTFVWHLSDDIIQPYSHPITHFFGFVEESDYLPIYVTIPEDFLSEEGGELALFINNECYGAEVIKGEMVPLKAYVLESDIDFTTADVEFRVHKYGTRAPAQVFNNYQVFDQGSQAYKTRKIDLNDSANFYQVTLNANAPTNETDHIYATLIGNYPNPFNPSTTISFSLAQPGNVRLSIYNIRGQLVKTLMNETKETGRHSIIWNGDDNSANKVSSGIYFYRIETSSSVETKKMLLMK